MFFPSFVLIYLYYTYYSVSLGEGGGGVGAVKQSMLITPLLLTIKP
jgi:hypothetical protein